MSPEKIFPDTSFPPCSMSAEANSHSDETMTGLVLMLYPRGGYRPSFDPFFAMNRAIREMLRSNPDLGVAIRSGLPFDPSSLSLGDFGTIPTWICPRAGSYIALLCACRYLAPYVKLHFDYLSPPLPVLLSVLDALTIIQGAPPPTDLAHFPQYLNESLPTLIEMAQRDDSVADSSVRVDLQAELSPHQFSLVYVLAMRDPEMAKFGFEALIAALRRPQYPPGVHPLMRYACQPVLGIPEEICAVLGVQNEFWDAFGIVVKRDLPPVALVYHLAALVAYFSGDEAPIAPEEILEYLMAHGDWIPVVFDARVETPEEAWSVWIVNWLFACEDRTWTG
jgi:hypothetical protein